MDREINDFFIALGDDMDSELETHKLFTQQADPIVKNRRIIFEIRAVDVPVRRGGGFYFFKMLTGQPLVANKFALDKKRKVGVAQDLCFDIKRGKPAITVAFPDSYDKLPQSLKEHPILGMALKMTYLARQSNQLQEDIMQEAGIQQSEIEDRLSQSQTRLNDFMLKQISDYNAMMESQVRQNKALPVPQPKEGNINYY
jgi:hypothetical protein